MNLYVLCSYLLLIYMTKCFLLPLARSFQLFLLDIQIVGAPGVGKHQLAKAILSMETLVSLQM